MLKRRAISFAETGAMQLPNLLALKSRGERPPQSLPHESRFRQVGTDRGCGLAEIEERLLVAGQQWLAHLFLDASGRIKTAAFEAFSLVPLVQTRVAGTVT